RHGLETVTPRVRLFAPAPDGRSFRVYEDVKRTAEGLAKLSSADAKAYPAFAESFARIGRMLEPMLAITPPSLDRLPPAADAWKLAMLGKSFRGLPKKDAFRLLRWGPMAVADLAAEWFETELVRAAVAARGIYGAFAGPWSAGTS